MCERLVSVLLCVSLIERFRQMQNEAMQSGHVEELLLSHCCRL